ncbi:MAG: toll/interleukin-1 receptor domain-containing protein [Verrucomicrobiota bacterium]
MHAFISYSTVNKKWSSPVKSALLSVGFQGFLAHEDLQLSEEWKASIIDELNKADVFVAILSNEFKQSEYCSQEVGFIVSRKKVLIIPLSIDGTIPYGFISHLQGVRVSNEDKISQVIPAVLLRKRPRIAIPAWIKEVEAAVSFRHAEAIVEPLVAHFSKFTDEEAVAFTKAALGNRQVWDASLCQTEYLPAFKKSNWKHLPKSLRADFSKKVKLPED